MWDNIYYLWLTVFFLAVLYNIYAYFCWRGQRAAWTEEKIEPPPLGAMVYDPMDIRPHKWEHPEFGPLVERVESKKLVPLLKVAGGIFMMWVVVANEGGDLSGLALGQVVPLGIFYCAIAYYTACCLFGLGKRVLFYRYGFVSEGVFGNREYSYGEIEEIIFTEELSRSNRYGCQLVWRTPLVIVRLHSGQALRFYSTVYGKVIKKFTQLRQNLVYNRKMAKKQSG